MAQTTPKHTQTVSGWAAYDTSGKITPYPFKLRSGIDPPVATFASAALPVEKMSSKGSEKSIGVPRQHQCCGCPRPCKCNPCHCEGFAIDPNTVTLIASVAPPVMMPSEGSEKSIEAEREGIHPKPEEHRSREVGHPSKTRNDYG